MSGFENDVMLAKNMNFDETAPKPHLGVINAAGKFPIGTGNTFPTPEILGGSITSSTLTVGYSSPNITLEAGGTIPTTFTGDNGTTATPSGNNITIYANNATNISGRTVAFTNSGSTSLLNLSDGITSQNTTLGYAAGPLFSYTGSFNTSVGTQSLTFTSGQYNCALGSGSLSHLRAGSRNIAVGFQALFSCINATDNIAIGHTAGAGLGDPDSNNILIGSDGIHGDSNVIRIGSNQTTCFIEGIVGNTVTGDFVNINSSGQLGVVTATSVNVTLSGDTGSLTANSFPFSGINTPNGTTNTLRFVESGGTMYLRTNDANGNLIIGNNALGGGGITTANTNVGLGNVFGGLTTGGSNVMMGPGNGNNITTGSNNVGIGPAVLNSLTTGVSNICIGLNGGTNYSSSESSNILINNIGTTAESNTIRIGTAGSSTNQQNRAFLAGVTGVTVSASAPVAIASTGQLSSLGFGTANQVLTSNGAGNSPTFQSVSAAGAITSITGNSGGAESPSAGNFNILGTGSITVSGTANTETVQLTGLTNHTVLVGAGTATITKVGPGSTGQILQSGGASSDPSYSTATYPSTAGTSGKILVSNGTNIVSSTPTYPNAAGTSGNVITSDGTNFTSSALPSNSSDVLAAMTTTVNNVTGDTTVYEPVIFDTSTFDVGSNYNASTGIFTAPSSGKYLVSTAITFSGIGVAHTSGEVRVYLNGGVYTRSSFNPSSSAVGGLFTFNTSIILPVDATGTIAIGVQVNGSTKTVGIQGNNFGYYSWMTVTLLGS